MMEFIIKLIIAEARSRADTPLSGALLDVVREVDRIIARKHSDLIKVREMQVSDDEKEEITQLILQAD